MRVLHLITGLGTGGAEVMLSQLVSGMDPLRFENRVVSMTDGGPIAERLARGGTCVHHLSMRPGIPNPAGWVRLRRLLCQFEPHLVQTWMYHANLLGCMATTGLPETHLIWGLHHSNLSWSANKAQTLLVARLCASLSHRVPEAIVCCSEAARRAHNSLGYDSERVVVIPNGYDTVLFRPDERAPALLRRKVGIPEEAPLVSLIARFHKQKNHRCFIDAASIVHQRRPDVHFILAGAGIVGQNAILTGWIDHAKLTRSTHLLGPIEDVQPVMAGSTVIASSSTGEGMSNVIGEAMACGAVCVVTDVGDSARVVGNTGIVVRPNDPERLAEGLLSALQLSPEARSRLGEAARRRIDENFSLRRAVSAYEELYHRVIENHPAREQVGR